MITDEDKFKAKKLFENFDKCLQIPEKFTRMDSSNYDSDKSKSVSRFNLNDFFFSEIRGDKNIFKIYLKASGDVKNFHIKI